MRFYLFEVSIFVRFEQLECRHGSCKGGKGDGEWETAT